MSTALWCLLGFAAWTWSLVVFGIGTIRVFKVLKGQEKPNAFPSDKPHGSEAYRRLLRAHANCVENLPVFGAVVIIGALTNLQSDLFHTLAIVTLAARIGQSIAHLSSGRSLIVNVRFTFFLVQIAAVSWMGLLVATNAAP